MIPNGLPVVPIYFENDDDSSRKLGRDSRLMFTAPATGEYLVAVTDARGFSGEKYQYELAIRRPRPGFRVRLEGGGPTVPARQGKSFKLVADRIDGFDGEIRIQVKGSAQGILVAAPRTIQAQHFTAMGAVYAAADALDLSPASAKAFALTASATINGREVVQQIGTLGEIKLSGPPKVLVRLGPPDHGPPALGETPEVTIHPGQTIAVALHVERRGFGGVLSFGQGGRRPESPARCVRRQHRTQRRAAARRQEPPDGLSHG